MAIADAFLIDYNNKRIYYDTTGDSVVYTVNALYTYMQDTFDELPQMDDPVPMSAQTPTEYTMINGWFIDNESIKWLTGGAIQTSGYTDDIKLLQFGDTSEGGDTPYIDCVAADVGKVVLGDSSGGSGDSGVLLAYDNTTRRWWVRKADAGDTFTSLETVSVQTGTGDGRLRKPSTTGEDLYANVYTLGTVTNNPYPNIYIFQDGAAISEWWEERDGAGIGGDTGIGHIDVLVKVRESGDTFGNGAVSVYARQYGDLFDNFTIDLNAGGRNAVPLATATDLNNTYNEQYHTYNVGDTEPIQYELVKDATGTAYTSYAEVRDVSGGTLSLGHIQGGAFSNGDSLFTFFGDTYVANLTSVPGDSVVGWTNIGIWFVNGYLNYDAQTSEFAIGDSITDVQTSAVARVVGDSAGAGATGRVWLANVVGSISDGDSLTGPGDTFRATANGTMVVANTANQNFQQQSAYPYDVFLECATRPLLQVYNYVKYTTRENNTYNMYSFMSDVRNLYFVSAAYVNAVVSDIGKKVTAPTIGDTGTLLSFNNSTRVWTVKMDTLTDYFDIAEGDSATIPAGTGRGDAVGTSAIVPLDGEEYEIAYTGYAPVKAAPFGTFAGGVWFGAQGVWLNNMAAADNQNFQLIDSNGTVRTPPVQVTIQVTGLVSGDRVSVFRTTGANTIIDKAIYTGDSINGDSGDSEFDVQETISTDTPSSGAIRIVDTTAAVEQRYLYDSWSGSRFYLNASTRLLQAYAVDDTAYIPFIDEQTGDSYSSEIVIYASPRNVFTRVRLKGILPFQSTPGQVTTSGYSVAAIRTTDSIVS